MPRSNATVRLLYYSENHINPTSALQAYQDIGRTARHRNQSMDITGALVCDQQWFVQVLEGPRAKVWNTFERVCEDDRHADIVLCLLMEIEARAFADWSMKLCIRSGRTEMAFRPFLRDGRLDPPNMRARELCDLVYAAHHAEPLNS